MVRPRCSDFASIQKRRVDLSEYERSFLTSLKALGKENPQLALTGLVKTLSDNFSQVAKVKFYVDGQEVKEKSRGFESSVEVTQTVVMRIDGRSGSCLRPVSLLPRVNRYAEGSALIHWGNVSQEVLKR